MIKVKIIRESLREDLLDEAKEDDIAKKYGVKTRAFSWKKLKQWVGENRSQRLKYMDWAASMIYSAGYSIGEVLKSLMTFEKFKDQMSQKDIKFYQSPPHLVDTYKKEVLAKRAGKERKAREKSELRASEEDRSVIYEDEHLFVVRPHHVEASCHYGRKTKWCIAQPGNTYFDDYTNAEGKVFYFIKDDRRKSDDQYAKVAVQVRMDRDEEIIIDGYWDRYDNEDMRQGGGYPAPKPVDELEQFFGDEIKKALAAIKQHAVENPPEIGEGARLEELDEEIYTRDFDSANLMFTSNVETYEDGTTMMINVNFNDSIGLEEIFDGDYSGAEIAALIRDTGEEEFIAMLAEFIFDDRWPLGIDEYAEVDEFVQMRGDTLNFDFFYAPQYFLDSGEARNYIDSAVQEHEDISDIWESVKEFTQEYLQPFLSAEQQTAIRDLAKTISNLSNRLKNLDITYDEDEAEIDIVQRQPYEVPLKIKSFNMPAKGYYVQSAVLNAVTDYHTEIRRALLPLEKALGSALGEVLDLIFKQMSKQTQIKFKGFEPQEVVPLNPQDIMVSVSKPNRDDLMGKGAKAKPVAVKSTVGFSLNRRDDVEQIKNSPQYIVALDRAMEQVYERAFQKFDIDEANKKIAAAYKKYLVDNQAIKNVKVDQGVEPTAYTESKKRIKVKLLR